MGTWSHKYSVVSDDTIAQISIKMGTWSHKYSVGVQTVCTAKQKERLYVQ